MISKRAIDLIIEFEVSSKEYYEKKLKRPEWPGLNSGITIGIGYDLGYSSPDEIRKDFAGSKVPKSVIEAMTKYSGITRSAARDALPKARQEIIIDWNDAYYVFSEISIPQWIKKVQGALPNTDKLSPDCLGVLVSLAYNRGPAFSAAGDKFREMRNIRTLMEKQEFSKIPAELRAMKRLWPTTGGLILRREKEARLFESGLQSKDEIKIPENTKVTTSTPAPIIVNTPPVVPTPNTVIVQSKPSLWSRISNNIFAKIMK